MSKSAHPDWGSMSKPARDAAYNNAAAVANSADLIRQRNESAVRFRAANATSLDLAYGPHERQKWDLYPAKDANAPCFVLIHGGYWQYNRREDFAHFAEGLMAHGWSVAMPGYRLAPEARLSEIVADIHAALDWLSTEGKSHGISGKIVLGGWSAGGQLAVMALNHKAVSAGFAISGIYELGPLRDIYVNEALRLDDDEAGGLSPLRLPVSPKPLHIAYGTQELPSLVSDSRDLHARRAAAHAPGSLIPVAGTDHFTVLHELQRADGVLTKAVLGAI